MNVSFLVSNERGWLSSNLFFYSLTKLGINTEEFYIDKGTVLAPEEITIYADQVAKKVNSVPWLVKNRRTEHVTYITNICSILKEWGNKQYVVHVV